MRVILASRSARRKRLLKKLFKKFLVVPADIDEKIKNCENPIQAAKRLAFLKAKKVAKKYKSAIVIGADTVVYVGKKIYGKAKTKQEARKMLIELSRRAHDVATGVAIFYPGKKAKVFVSKAKVKLNFANDKLLEEYLRTNEWKGRAGCYDISGAARNFAALVSGEKETVIGLPLRKLRTFLKT
ncbi:MAG: Maf family nucleotide pyrophosphatase [Candidatus Micrarchaeota archaeon]|nr:Maf family nucleotide pyrophosphatase [Candidatus Micrarchaeota archaeon]